MSRVFYKVMALVLGSFGLSCGDKGNEPVEYAPMPEYGVPTAHYVLSGRVTKASDLSPIAGLQVDFLDHKDTTDAQGQFSLDITDFPCGLGGGTPCSLTVADVDGAENGGLFADTTVALTLTQTDPGDGSYDAGTFEQTDLDIRLNEDAK